MEEQERHRLQPPRGSGVEVVELDQVGIGRTRANNDVMLLFGSFIEDFGDGVVQLLEGTIAAEPNFAAGEVGKGDVKPLCPDAGERAQHLLGLLGGAIWGLGTVFNLVAASFSGVAISYAIGQSAPMVAALWGVLAWKEFEGAPDKAKMYLALMFVFYYVGILLVAKANG